jgi:hypothetical protein
VKLSLRTSGLSWLHQLVGGSRRQGDTVSAISRLWSEALVQVRGAAQCCAAYAGAVYKRRTERAAVHHAAGVVAVSANPQVR